MIFALSSACYDVVITSEQCLAHLKSLARLARWHSLELPHIQYTSQVGRIDEPGAVDVQVVPDWSQFPGIPAEDLAFHTTQNGRPCCFVNWSAIKASGGTLYGPNGLSEAIHHELCETLCDPTTERTVTNPDGKQEAYEVCDRLQGTGYFEPGSEGIYLANALGPIGFLIGGERTQGVDIASDLRLSMFTTAFPLAPGGYYEADGVNVYGDRVTAAKRAELDRRGVRSRKVRPR